MMLLEYLRLFGWVFRKMDKIIKNLGNFGVLRRGVETPRCSEGPRHGVACPRCGMAEKRIFPSSSLLRHSSKGFATA